MFYLGTLLVSINIHNRLASYNKGRHCPYLEELAIQKIWSTEMKARNGRPVKVSQHHMAPFNWMEKTVTVPRKVI